MLHTTQPLGDHRVTGALALVDELNRHVGYEA